jgi:hypothetical protein
MGKKNETRQASRDKDMGTRPTRGSARDETPPNRMKETGRGETRVVRNRLQYAIRP